MIESRGVPESADQDEIERWRFESRRLQLALRIVAELCGTEWWPRDIAHLVRTDLGVSGRRVAFAESRMRTR